MVGTCKTSDSWIDGAMGDDSKRKLVKELIWQQFARTATPPIESIDIKSILLGIPDRFIEHSSREEMLESAGLSVAKILDRLKPLLEK